MSKRRTPSLTRTITLLVAVTVLSTATLAGFFSYLQSNHQLEEVFDAELAQSTRIVQGLVRHLNPSQSLQDLTQTLSETLKLPERIDEEEEGDEILPGGAGHRYEKKIAFQIWSPDGELLLSTHLRGQRFDPTPGYRWVEQLGYSWRTYNLQDPATGLWIQTAQREDVRGELSRQLAMGNTLPLLMVLPLLGIAIAIAIHWGFIPLRRLEAPVRDMAPQAIHPLDDQAAPKEVRGLVLAINGLLQRLDEALDRERRFSADAAHELRTPLAALRLNLEKVCDDNPGQYDGLIQAVDRMSHLVEQMLLLSRVDSGLDFNPGLHNLSDILVQCIADVTPLALRKGIEPEFDDDTRQATILCNTALISTMVRSILANAIQYSPSDTIITTHLQTTREGYRISVCDQGPGIPAEDRERAAGRFVRLDQRKGSGAGLGLAIARRIAELHGGTLALADRDDGTTGLCVQLNLPAKH